MEYPLFTAYIIFILFFWIWQTVKVLFPKETRRNKLGLRIGASFCLIFGAICFFGTGLSSFQGLGLPNSFEWPVGYSENVLFLSEGFIVVPHIPSGRTQVYDKDLTFIRGWNIPAAGGVFKLIAAGKNKFHIYTTRGKRKLLYGLDGKLISSGTYDSGELAQLRTSDGMIRIPTPLYLILFTSSWYSFLVMAIGLCLLIYINKTAEVS